MSRRLIEFNHISTGAREERALLFLHGFLGSSDDWRPTMERFENSRYCLAVDLPGHGKTRVKDSDDLYRFENIAEQLLNWLDAVDIENADLVGYSMGGRLALYMLISYPERFGKCVLESASPGLESSSDRTDRIEYDNNLADRLLAQPLETFLSDWYDQPLFQSLKSQPERIKELINSRKNGDRGGMARALRGMSTGRQPSLWGDLAKIQTDVRLIVGADDHKFVSIAQEMQKRSEKIDISIVGKSGHNVHLEQPRRFFDILSDFLKINTGE